MRHLVIGLLAALSSTAALAADGVPGKSGALYDEGAALDARYFEAFNHCEHEGLVKLPAQRCNVRLLGMAKT